MMKMQETDEYRLLSKPHKNQVKLRKGIVGDHRNEMSWRQVRECTETMRESKIKLIEPYLQERKVVVYTGGKTSEGNDVRKRGCEPTDCHYVDPLYRKTFFDESKGRLYSLAISDRDGTSAFFINKKSNQNSSLDCISLPYARAVSIPNRPLASTASRFPGGVSEPVSSSKEQTVSILLISSSRRTPPIFILTTR